MYKYVRYINYVSRFVSFMQNHKWYFYFFIQNVKRNWKFCHQYSRNRTNRTIYNFDRLLKYIKTQIFHNTQKLWMNLMIYIFFWKCVFLKIFYVFFKSVICSSWNRLVWARGLIKDKDRNNKLLKIILFYTTISRESEIASIWIKNQFKEENFDASNDRSLVDRKRLSLKITAIWNFSNFNIVLIGFKINY